VLSPPPDLALDALTGELTRQWGVAVRSIGYLAVGFGSHHWTVTDPAGGGWFVTVDDLETERRSGADSADQACGRLSRALGTARALRDTGETFVLAPVLTAGGDPLARITDRYAASLYPLVEGESFEFAGYDDGDHRDAVLEMVVRVHGAPETVRRRATEDDLAIRNRDALEAALSGGVVAECGPYAERAARLLHEHAGSVRRLLVRYDGLVAGADLGRSVLTHGEPHPGNTLRTKDGWRLIDWDTVKIAPPERDLWLLGGDLAAYTDTTGVDVLPEMLTLFRLRWEITDLAMEVERFRRPHTGDANDEEGWQILQSVVGGI
jgi:spectinomycin phosphotransferase/16S rRNA (guanine(1405)-N(7))-methyltransferase